MTKTIVNLTMPAVVAEINDVLENCSHHYQRAFSIPELRQELMAHILSRISNCYVVVDHTQKPSITFDSLPCSLEEKVCIKALIRREMENIFCKNEKELSHQISEEIDPNLAPSHWFG
ncbi:hypothetical protein NUACC21_50700 [Scytonema sp. NUACC21]